MDFAQPPHHGVVAKHDAGSWPSDPWQTDRSQSRDETEAIFLPVARQVLAAVEDRAVLVDQSRAAISANGASLSFAAMARSSEAAGHPRQACDGFIPRRLVVRMAPALELPHRGLETIALALILEPRRCRPGTRTTDVHGDDRVMAGQHQLGASCTAPIRPASSGGIADRPALLYGGALAGKQDLRPAHRELA